MPPTSISSEIETSLPETTAFHTQSWCNSALHHDWCKPHSWWHCLWFILAALFLFRTMLCTHTGLLDKVRTLWICTLSAIAMQMAISIAMFHGFSLASFMQAVCIHHDYEWSFDYAGCWVFGGCGMWLWRNIAICSWQYKVTQNQHLVLWEDTKMERKKKLRKCENLPWEDGKIEWM